MRSLLFSIGLVALALSSCGATPADSQSGAVRGKRISITDAQASIAKSLLPRLPLFVTEEDVRVEGADAVQLYTAGGMLTAIPFVGSFRQEGNDRIAKCLVLLQSNDGKTGVIEREGTGFSDDYEPCASIQLIAVTDLNSDGTDDLVYEIHMSDATGRTYALLDVYLTTKNQRVCFSSKASIHLSSKYPIGLLASEPGAPAAQFQSDEVLRGLSCE